MSPQQRRELERLQRNGWSQDFQGRWQHPKLSPHGALALDQALRVQLAHERAQALGDRERDMAAVATNAGDVWIAEAVEAVRETATHRAEFTTDDVLDDHPGLPEPHDGRAWGPVMVRAKADGIVAPTDRMAPSNRRSSNGRRKMAWRSLLCGQAAAMELAEVVGHG